MSSGLLVGKNRRVHLPNSGDAPHVKSCDFFLDVQFQYVRHKFQKIEQCSNLENLNFKKWSGYMNSVSRKERERRERINYVLNVAEGLFAEKGFVKVTMRQIAQKAEFALGTIYSFFKGKQHIYDQLLEKKSEQYISFVKSQIESETNPRKQVEKYIEAKLTYLRNNMSFLRLYFAEIHTPHLATAQGLRIKVKEKYNTLISRLTQVLGKGMSEGIFVKGEPDALARALDGLTNAFALLWLEKNPSQSVDGEIEIAKEVFLRGALARG